MVLALAAVILAIGAPNFNEFRRNNRLTAAGNDLLGAVMLARTEAIKGQQAVTLCPSSDPQAALPTCSGTDFKGWIVFADLNTNCQRDAAEPLLRAEGPADMSVKTKANGKCVSFAPTGFVLPEADGPADGIHRVLFCDERGTAKQAGTDQSAARGIQVTRTGRARVTRDIKSGTDLDLTKWPISCP